MNRESRVLVIDDVRVFHWNPDIFGEPETTYARTPEGGIKALSEDEWDTVMLDHDLGWNVDIMQVVDWAIENRDSVRVGRFYSHSSNPTARKRVAQKLLPYFSVNLLNLHDPQVKSQVQVESIYQ